MNAINRTVTLTIVPNKRWFTLSAGWMVVAAALMAHPTPWDWTNWQTHLPWLVRIFALWILVDSVWGSLWHLLVERSLRRILDLGSVRPVAPKLPYTRKNSAAYRAVVWREKLRLHADGAWQSVVLLSIGAVALSIWLGWVAFLATILFGITAFGFSNQPPTRVAQHTWLAVLMMLFPFWMVQSLSGQGGTAAMLLAVAATVIFLGILRLDVLPAQAERWVIFGEIAAAVVLFAARQPLGGTMILLTAVASILLRPFEARIAQPVSAIALAGVLAGAYFIAGVG